MAVKVLIVDDSAMIRQLLSELLASDRGIEVVGTAADPYIARDKIKELNPDVITLDVEMPRMDGLTFLKNLMRLRPMPVVMISSLTDKGAQVTLQALELGAVDFVTKPKIDVQAGLNEYRDTIVEKVKMAARVTVNRLVLPPKTLAQEPVTHSAIPSNVPPKLSADAILSSQSGISKHYRTTEKILAIGASTGGTEALRYVISQLPPDMPGIVISQHIPPAFSTTFAARLNRESALTVFEAEDGQQILPGHVYVAPGDFHLLVERSGARYICRLNDGPRVNRHKPSVDVMFRSVAQYVGPNAVGFILTGMGDDGARGLLEMKQAGAATVAQDEASSVVWGMPGEAVKLGAADQILPLSEIPARMVQFR